MARDSTTMRKMVCDRDDAAFMFVSPTCRLATPFSMSDNTCVGEVTISSFRPLTYTPRSGSSLICSRDFGGAAAARPNCGFDTAADCQTLKGKRG